MDRARCRFGLHLLVMLLASLVVRVSSAQDLFELEEQAIRSAVERIAPSVVRIETIGGLEQVGEVLLGEGPTTGLVVSSDGYIISSAFNFLRLPTSILIVLPENRRVPAQIVARDRSRMLVLLKIDPPSPLAVPEPAPLDQIQVGQRAIAVGRALSAEQPNVSAGIVSATRRIFGKAIQTDAKVSPSNYGGPLIDLNGRVLGVLVPMSPDKNTELAGAEWYDGGIGFAVPLVDINARLDRMKKGETLHPGVLGLTLKPGDMYSLPAEVVAIHPKSPAHQAGIRPGDVITEFNGKPIARQVELKHVLGPLYAGEKVKLVTSRGDQKQELAIELVEKLNPYEHPFLGILPTRNDAAGTEGIGIRMVYPDSPAAKMGLQTSDRILQLDGKAMADAMALRQAIASLEPRGKFALTIKRDNKEAKLEGELGRLPEELPKPDSIPALAESPAVDPAPAPGPVEIQVPEEPNQCVALVPRTYRPETPHGVIVYLPQPGELKNDAFVKRWQAVCEKRQLIVVAPQSLLPNMWMPMEVGFIRKALDHVVANYTVDRTRIAVYGYQASGAMAYLTAFRNRDRIRAVVTADAPISALSRPPDNDPVERLALLVAYSDQSRMKSRLTAGIKALREFKFPVTVLQQSGEPRDLNEQELLQVAAWIDTLDRI